MNEKKVEHDVVVKNPKKKRRKEEIDAAVFLAGLPLTWHENLSPKCLNECL